MMQRHPREGAKALHEALERRLGRPVSRREFLQASIATGVAVPSLSALLAACGGNPRDKVATASQVATPDNPVKLPLVGKAIPDGLQPEKGAKLQIYNWTLYIWKHIIDDFCAEYDCDYDLATFNNMEEGVAKMLTGDLKVDVFFPTIDYIGKLTRAKLLQPLNHSYIPNLEANAWDVFQNPYYDQGWQYSVPYAIYTTGISYRRDVVTDDEIRGMSNPYDIFWDPAHSGRMGIYDSYRDAMAMVLLRNGITDINTEDPKNLEIVRQDLLKLVETVNIRTSINGSYSKLPKAVYDIHQSWSGDIVAAWGYVLKYVESEYEKLGFWYTADRKGPIDNDLLAIPANAEHPVLAHAFLNYLLDYQHAMDNFSWNGYQPPQKQADVEALTTTEGLYSKISNWAEPAMYVAPWMPDAVVRQEDFGIGYRSHELSAIGTAAWQAVWQEFKAGA